MSEGDHHSPLDKSLIRATLCSGDLRYRVDLVLFGTSYRLSHHRADRKPRAQLWSRDRTSSVTRIHRHAPNPVLGYRCHLGGGDRQCHRVYAFQSRMDDPGWDSVFANSHSWRLASIHMWQV